jgi:ribonuclease HII
MDPTSRPQDPLAYEARFWGRGVSVVAGVDEVGRGPLAGPVVAAAVVLRPGCPIEGADDSKRLSALERTRLDREIRQSALAFGLGAASVREIDRLNIARATALAMRRALEALPVEPDHVVVDGRPVSDLGRDHEAVVGGDARIHSIGCASIIAKTCRDALMLRLAARYPGFRWNTNKGYGTPAHLAALKELGPSPHHRRSFGGVALRLEL